MFSYFRYIFFGDKESLFAEIILRGLADSGFNPIAVFSNAKEPLDAGYLKSLSADFFVVASFGKILKKDILDVPGKGIINVHPSLLPKYRGPSPIQSALLNNEKETGVTLFFIDEKIDHGKILAREEMQIANSDNYASLMEKLAGLSVKMLVKTLPEIMEGKSKPEPQDESQATYTKKFTSEDAYIDLKKDNPKEIWLKIRALNPEPGIYTILELKNGKKLRLKLLEAEFLSNELKLAKVQPEGKRPMSYQAFLNGYSKLLN
ncbi:MAG: methionyl-tRNA formyltransferase [Patescibacteria group bacterium]